MTLFHSTRAGAGQAASPVSFSSAMQRGLAPDGGLYVPQEFPTFDPSAFTGHESMAEMAARILAPFFASDALAPHLEEICRDAFAFPIPLVPLAASPGLDAENRPAALLELFHGPTAAFKDVGARFFAECISRLPVDDSGAEDVGADDVGGNDAGGKRSASGPRTVLVATSGDTGGAVAAALYGKPDVEVVVLFPLGGVSKEQQHQLTCWGGNVHSFGVRGTFDDCQRVLKQSFADEAWRESRRLTTANSINVARLLPQLVYYAFASVRCRELFAGGQPRSTEAPNFIVPSGNVGNATAALWAKRMGFPIGRVVLATNRNRTVPDYLDSGDWQPRPSQRSLANAMDVGDPSNMERVFDLYPTIEELRAHVCAMSVDDDAIGATIASGVAKWGRVFDPHTATAVYALETHPELVPAVLVSTAHPAKFRDIVGPRIDAAVEIPDSLAELMSRPTEFREIEADLDALRAAMDRVGA